MLQTKCQGCKYNEAGHFGNCDRVAAERVKRGERAKPCVNCGTYAAFCSCSVWDTLYKGVSPEVLADAKRQHADKLKAEARAERAESKLYNEQKARRLLLKQIRILVREERQ